MTTHPEAELITERDYGTPAVASEQTVTLEIDGRSVTVPAGTSVMRAAAEAGIDIPKLCATDSLAAFGSCRLCLVEVEGGRVDLGRIDCPLFLLAGATDHITPPDQVWALDGLTSTPPEQVTRRLAPGGHLGLFMGRESLREHWAPTFAQIVEHSRPAA